MTRATDFSESIFSTLAEDPDLREIVQLFVEEMPGRVASILSLLQESDWEGLRRVSHQLKGAAGSYGFHEITPAAKRVEDAVRETLPAEEVRQMVDELVDMCNRIRAEPPPHWI